MASLGETFVTKSYTKGKPVKKKSVTRVPPSKRGEGSTNTKGIIERKRKKITNMVAAKKARPSRPSLPLTTKYQYKGKPYPIGSEGPKVKPTSKKTMAKRSMPKRKAM
jgi:hypothetical protein